MAENIITRDISKKDRNALKVLISKIDIFSEEDKRISLDLIDEFLKDPENNDYWVRCATENNVIQGFICYGPASLCVGTYDVYYIAVPPEFRRKGIGKMLIEDVESVLIKKKARMLLIETTSDPQYGGTLKFYERLGYVEAERLRDYYRDGEDKITFQKRF